MCSLLAAFALAYVISPNTDAMAYERENYPQYRFAETMKRSEHPTLLNYGFLDSGFYMAADIFPEQKYFCTLNIRLEEMDREMDACLEQGQVEFVVTRDEDYTGRLYKKVDEMEFAYEGIPRIYRLYQRR